jgi:hypothetical protein
MRLEAMSQTRQCTYPGFKQWARYPLETFQSMICNELFCVFSHGYSILTLVPAITYCGVGARVGLKGGIVTYLHPDDYITGSNHSHYCYH